MVAPSSGPMTFTGTCTYAVGQDEVVLIDPGPANKEHIAALLAALNAETVAAILVTHTHNDHSPAARALKAATGAKIFGCAPPRTSGTPIDAVHDLEYAPDVVMRDGDSIESNGFFLQCLATPGHTQNHVCFTLPQESALFTGDHVMAWSTSLCCASRWCHARLSGIAREAPAEDQIFWPGHGGPVKNPQAYVNALIRHRREREEAILACIRAGHSAIPAIAAKVYEGLDPRLTPAAGYSILAHIEDLVSRGLVKTEGALTPGSVFYPA
jgi:glyoxylase-like metal-dependent hydrolase (beta-lactamase superfamily II)